MAERNWAEWGRKMEDAPTISMARGLGWSHAGYGWAATPPGGPGWTDAHVTAYHEGFASYKAGAPKPSLED